MKKLTKTKIFLIFAIIFIVCFGFYLTKDEPLNPRAAQWITEASQFKENDAYYLLLGLSTSATSDPITAGKQTYQLYKDKPPLWHPDEKTDAVEKKESLASPPFNEGLFCQLKESDCWSYIFANTDKIQATVQPYSVIKERYLRFIQSKDYHTNLISLSAIPQYQFLTKGNQIILLQAIDQAKTDPQSAIKNIKTDLADLRLQLQTADNLIFKLLVNAMVAKDIQAITVLEQKNGILTSISHLTPEEKSLDKPFKFELAFQRNILAHFGEDYKKQSYFKYWIYKIAFYFFLNQGMTINQIFSHYKVLLGLNTLNYSEINEYINNNQDKSKFHIKNIIGSTITGISQSNLTYMKYYLRMIDTDLKIMLSNEINAQRSTGTIDLSKIQNPYYQNSNHPFWSTDGKQVCLDKPKFEDDENTDNKVCLIVKL